MMDQVLHGRRYGTGQVYVTGTRQVLTNVHDSSMCEGSHCIIHAPSRHPLVNAPTHWSVTDCESCGPTQVMERICPHGNFHPDPDDVFFIARTDPMRAIILTLHDCCGCCRGEDSE